MGHSPPSPVKPRIASTMGKARILMEAMEYIKAYRGCVMVIKYGGSAMVHEDLRSSFADDVALLRLVGIKPIIVHGGGPQITDALRRQGLESTWVEGLRVTGADTMRVVQSTLAGELNPDIVRLINAHGAVATGVTGLDANLFTVRQAEGGLGFVGDIVEVNPGLVSRLVDEGLIPVIAPLGRGIDGHTYNVNADTAAGSLAAELSAEKLVFLTDVEGLYRDFADADSLVSRISVDGVRDMLAGGGVSKGMRPKLQAVVAAMEAGTHRSHVLDGRVQHAVLLEIFTPEGIGTMITGEEES